MDLANIGRRLLNVNFWLMVVAAVVGFMASRYAGNWLAGKMPGGRFVAPLALIATGAMMDTGHGYGYAFGIGAGIDLATVVAAKTGVLKPLAEVSA